MTTASRAQWGYRIVLPPGWLLLPVRDRTDAELHRLIMDQYREAPRDSAMPFISRLADAVIAGIRTARDVDVVDVILPLGAAWGSAVSTSIALAIGKDRMPDDGELVETEAGEAVRTERQRTPESLRSVEYVWRIPASEDSLLVATFSIVGDDDPELAPIVDALTTLCDAVLSTLRWDPTPEETP